MISHETICIQVIIRRWLNPPTLLLSTCFTMPHAIQSRSCRVFMECPRFVSFREGKILIESTCRDYIFVLRNSGTRHFFSDDQEYKRTSTYWKVIFQRWRITDGLVDSIPHGAPAGTTETQDNTSSYKIELKERSLDFHEWI